MLSFLYSDPERHNLDLHLTQPVFPNYHIWRDTILAVIQENHPDAISELIYDETQRSHSLHSIGVHRFTSIEIQIAKHRNQLFGIIFLNSFLELFDVILALTAGLHLLDDFLQVACYADLASGGA